MKMAEHNAIIIGYGKFAKNHSESISYLKSIGYSIDLLEVSRTKGIPPENKAKILEAKLDLKRKLGYTPNVSLKPKKMIRNQYKRGADIAIISTPIPDLLEYTQRCADLLDHKMHILCEKPGFAPHQTEDARRILGDVIQKGINYAVDAQYSTLDSLIGDNKIEGTSYLNIINSTNYMRIKWGLPKFGGFADADCMSTMVDAIAHLVSVAPSLDYFDPAKVTIEDYMKDGDAAVIKFPNAEIIFGRNSSERSWEHETDMGRFKFLPKWEKDSHFLYYYVDGKEKGKIKTMKPVAKSMELFLKRKHPFTASEALKLVEIVDALVKAHPTYSYVRSSFYEAFNTPFVGKHIEKINNFLRSKLRLPPEKKVRDIAFNNFYWPAFNYGIKESLTNPKIRKIYESNPEVLRILAESLPFPVDTESISKKIRAINIFLKRDLREKDKKAKEEKIKEYILEKKPGFSLPLILNYVLSSVSAK